MPELDFLYLGGLELYKGCTVTVTGAKLLHSIRNTKGGQVVQSVPRAAGQNITINANGDIERIYGYITESQKEQIETRRDAGQAIELRSGVGTWSCIILIDGINLEPINRLTEDCDTLHYYGTIQLRTI